MGQGVYKVILIANTEFGQIWPKIWPICIFRPREGSGVYKVILMANTEFCQIWPKIWPICIFNLREGLRGLNSNFDVKNEIWPTLAKNGQKYGQYAFLGLGRGQGV